MARKVNEGQTEGGLPYLSFGEGPLLVVFPGLGMTNANPSGIQRWGEMRLLAPQARTFTIHGISRRVALAYGTTIEDHPADRAKGDFVGRFAHRGEGQRDHRDDNAGEESVGGRFAVAGKQTLLGTTLARR